MYLFYWVCAWHQVQRLLHRTSNILLIAKVLETAAQKNGCYMKEGKGHKLVYNKAGIKVTEIPNSVKDNNTCRSIIKVINAQC